MDARVRMTKSLIRNTFFDLLKDNPVEKITVMAICQGAQINRTTFYKYYDNPYDLLGKLEVELLDNIKNQILALDNKSLSSIFRIVLNDMVDKKAIYLTLFSDNVDGMFKKSLFDLVYVDNMKNIKRNYPSLSEDKQYYLFYFIAEGCTGIVNRWITDGMKESPEYLASYLEKLVYSISGNALLSDSH